MDWGNVIYSFFHGDPHKLPHEVGRLTLEQYIVLSRDKKDKKGKISVKTPSEAERLSKWWKEKEAGAKQLETAELLYRLYVGEDCCEFI